MNKYIVTIASDWDDNRCHVESYLLNTKEEVSAMLKTSKEECLRHFLKDDEYVIEEYDNNNGYFCYCGTIDEPQMSMGWEKFIVKNISF